MMDNLSVHKVAGVRPDLEVAGAALHATAQPGLQPDRAGVCQAQDAVALRLDPNTENALECHRFVAGQIFPL